MEAIIFVGAFLLSLLGTLEVVAISKFKLVRSTIYALMNSVAYCVTVLVLVTEPNRWGLAVWYVAGWTMAAPIGLVLWSVLHGKNGSAPREG